MTPKQRGALRLALVLIVISGGLLGFALIHTDSLAAFSGTFYGANETWVNSAVGATFPQTLSTACTVADAAAFTNYTYLMNGKSLRFTSTTAQADIENNNQKSGASQWGHATPTNSVAGITNIAPDFGNDPRSAAYMSRAYNLSNVYVHNYIYRWSMAHSTEPTFGTQVLEATTLLGRALQITKAPVIATINGGLHAVLVTGIYSTSSPASNFPANITGLVYRDPEGVPTSSRFEVSINTWSGGNFSTPFGVYSLWSLYYGDLHNVGDKLNSSDPEPSVGIYKPTTDSPVHWYLGFNWVQVDIPYRRPMVVPTSPYFSQTSNPDVAFDAVKNAIMILP